MFSKIEDLLDKYNIKENELEKILEKYFFMLNSKKISQQKYFKTASGSEANRKAQRKYYYKTKKNNLYHPEFNPTGIKRNKSKSKRS